MPKFYLLGGENIVKRNCRDINEQAFLDAGGQPAVLVFPWARASFDRAYVRRRRLSAYLTGLGSSTVDFAEYSDSFEEISRKVACSNLIYFTGGRASVLVERLINRNVDRLLRKYNGIIVGRSAGALALGKKCVVTKNRLNPTSMIIRGIGLLDFNLKAHYTPSKDGELKMLSREEPIYAITERSALIYHEGRISSMGDVYVFQKGEKIRID